MAPITTTVSSQQATFGTNTRGRTLTNPYFHGNIKAIYFEYTNSTGGTLVDGTVIDFGPVLKSKLYLPSVLLKVSAMSTSRVLNIGYQEHTDLATGDTVAGDVDAFVAAKDVSSAVVNAFNPCPTGTTPLTLNGDSVNLIGSVTGGTIPDGAIIAGYLFYLDPFSA